MKRFIDTELMLRPWFRNLPPHLKCLWLWMLTRCDMAGVIDMDWELASFAIGQAVTDNDLDAMDGNVVVIGNGRLFIPGYIPFQYGELRAESRVHHGVLKCLASHGIQYPINSLCAVADSLSVLSNSTKATATVKDKVKDKDKEQATALASWTVADYLKATTAIAPEYSRLAGLPAAVKLAFESQPDAELRAKAWNEFSSACLNTVDGVKNPGKLLAGYMRNARNDSPGASDSWIADMQ